jgi:hypothetical protein
VPRHRAVPTRLSTATGCASDRATSTGAIEDIDEISDCLVVHLEDPGGGPGRLVLFVRPKSAPLPSEAADQIRGRLRRELSPRHVPDDIITVSEIPKTPTGKKMEVPVKRAILEPAHGNPGDGLDEFRRLHLTAIGQISRDASRSRRRCHRARWFASGTSGHCHDRQQPNWFVPGSGGCVGVQ